MIVELLTRTGPVRIEAQQVVLRQDNGAPVCVAAHYGPDGCYAVAHAGDKDFNRMLRALGVEAQVVCDTLAVPPLPAGARLLAGPRS